MQGLKLGRGGLGCQQTWKWWDDLFPLIQCFPRKWGKDFVHVWHFSVRCCPSDCGVVNGDITSHNPAALQPAAKPVAGVTQQADGLWFSAEVCPQSAPKGTVSCLAITIKCLSQRKRMGPKTELKDRLEEFVDSEPAWAKYKAMGWSAHCKPIGVPQDQHHAARPCLNHSTVALVKGFHCRWKTCWFSYSEFLVKRRGV